MWGKPSYRVLAIEDRKYCKKNFQKQLAKHGVFLIYTDPEAVHNKIQNIEPDIILYDVEVFMREGKEHLKKLTTSYSTPVYVMGDTDDGILEALFAGAKGCIHKPDVSSANNIGEFIKEIVLKVEKKNKRLGLFTIFG